MNLSLVGHEFIIAWAFGGSLRHSVVSEAARIVWLQRQDYKHLRSWWWRVELVVEGGGGGGKAEQD